MKKILVIAADQERLGMLPGPHTFTPEHDAMLRSCLGPEDELIVATPEEAPSLYAEATAVAAFPARMPDVSLLPSAEWLHSFSAGVDRILTPAVAESSIRLSNSRGVHATPIAEHIIAFMLNFTRGFIKTFPNQQKHAWIKDENLHELKGAVVLVVGLGKIGTEVARLAHTFGAHVHAIVRTLRQSSGQARQAPDFIEKLGTLDDLNSWLRYANFVIITLPQTKETHHLFNRYRFALMKNSGIIINIGRGGIIDEKDLIEALKAGAIAGAGLDVTEEEPLPPNSPLWNMPNVILTPHHSGLSHRYMDRAIELLCKNIDAYLKGEKLPTEVDKKLGY